MIIENGQIKSEITNKTDSEERNLLEPEFIERKKKIKKDLGD